MMLEDVIIYGAGQYGKEVYEKYSNQMNVLFFVDKNPEKQGRTLYEKEIKSPDILTQFIRTKVIIAVSEDREIRNYLLYLGSWNIKKYYPLEGIVSVRTKLDRDYVRTSSTRWIDDHDFIDFDAPLSCTSQICNQNFFDMPFFQYWLKHLKPSLYKNLKNHTSFSLQQIESPIIYHRKLWEWIYICQTLYEQHLLHTGKKGVCFGVGKECLPDLFASFGCEILATDLSLSKDEAQVWVQTGQHLTENIRELNRHHFCTQEEFEKRVSYRDVDMNDIPGDITGYDFCWSSCALEHLGSLRHGLDFIKNSLNTLKTGGIAIHTTEYNLYSNDDTIESKGLSVYRRRDIEAFVDELERDGHYVFPVDWHVGDGAVDRFIDTQPSGKKGMHLRLRVGEDTCVTSIGLIIRK